jgi:predicted translin family RNA/ssDNA-binding protein
VIFKTLTREEYEQLSPEQRMDYLRRLQDDIRQKMDLLNKTIQETNKRLTDSGH